MNLKILSIFCALSTTNICNGFSFGVNVGSEGRNIPPRSIYELPRSPIMTKLSMSATSDIKGSGFNTRLDDVFRSSKERGEAAFVGFITAG